jgi:hypothetical protein
LRRARIISGTGCAGGRGATVAEIIVAHFAAGGEALFRGRAPLALQAKRVHS